MTWVGASRLEVAAVPCSRDLAEEEVGFGTFLGAIHREAYHQRCARTSGNCHFENYLIGFFERYLIGWRAFSATRFPATAVTDGVSQWILPPRNRH
jgi:hypothetical protein